jgi:hypothetical protein
MSVLSAAHRGVAGFPVLAFMLISLWVGFVTAAIPPIVDSEILPFGLPLQGLVGGSVGVAFAAFLVTAALSGRAGVADLGRRSVRWRVPVPLVPNCSVLRSCRCDADLARDLRPASSSSTLRRLAASSCGGRSLLSAATGAISTCRGDWIHWVPPASLAGPLQPLEAHPVRGTAVGGMAHARSFRRGRLGT